MQVCKQDCLQSQWCKAPHLLGLQHKSFPVRPHNIRNNMKIKQYPNIIMSSRQKSAHTLTGSRRGLNSL